MNPKAQTDFLFARPSFGSGFARGLDLFGTFDAYNTSDTEADADETAIANDWRVVGQDLATAIGQVREK